MSRQQETASLIQELIRRPSRNPPGDEKECALFIFDYLTKNGVEADLIDAPFEGRPQVVAWVRGAKGFPTLILNGHIDVVPEGDPSDWSVPPFEGVIRDGKVFGRGASDMKGALAAMMLLAKKLTIGKPLSGNVMFQFVAGEETGEPGTRHLLMDKKLVGEWGIVLEATALKVSTAQNGLIWYQIDVKGKQSHASLPHEGINAVTRGARLISDIEDYGRILTGRKHPLGNTATASPTMVIGGIKENIIPDHCRIKIDRRILPGETVAEADREMQSIVDKASRSYPDTEYSCQKLQVFESAEIDPDCELVRVLQRHSFETAGIPATLWGEFGSTDARNFVNDAKIPCVVWGPGPHDGAHTVDEQIDINEVLVSVNILEKVARELLT